MIRFETFTRVECHKSYTRTEADGTVSTQPLENSAEFTIEAGWEDEHGPIDQDRVFWWISVHRDPDEDDRVECETIAEIPSWVPEDVVLNIVDTIETGVFAYRHC